MLADWSGGWLQVRAVHGGNDRLLLHYNNFTIDDHLSHQLRIRSNHPSTFEHQSCLSEQTFARVLRPESSMHPQPARQVAGQQSAGGRTA